MWGLLDASAVECRVVSHGIAVVFAQCAGKVVIAREVLLGAHIEIVVRGVVEYGINGSFRGDAYGAGRESCVEIGVVGRWGVEVLVEYSTQR